MEALTALRKDLEKKESAIPLHVEKKFTSPLNSAKVKRDNLLNQVKVEGVEDTNLSNAGSMESVEQDDCNLTDNEEEKT